MKRYQSSAYNLLLIEDNPGDVVLIRDFIGSIDPETTLNVSGTFKKAGELLLADAGSFDLILLDLKLPDKEGKELIKGVVELSGGVPVVVLTGYSDMQFSIQSLNLGVSDYIVKDELSENVLWKSIRYSIERNRASKQLKESEQRYRYLFENNPASILIYNLISRMIVDLNQEAEKKYGYSKEEFKNLRIDDIFHRDLDNLFPGSEIIFEEGAGLKPDFDIQTHKKRDGELFFAELNGHYIQYNGEKSVLLLINDVTEKIEMQEQLLESSIQAEEAERNRIALELHDGIVQQMVACGMFIQNLAKKVEEDEELSSEVDRLYNLLSKTTIQTRDISHNLESAEFENSSLSDLLHKLIRQLSSAGSIQFVFNNHLSYDSIFSISLKTNTYRLVQELSNNILKHSNASKAVLTIEEIGEVIFLTIKDDGEGFDYIASESNGLGLRNVENRIIRLGGKIEFSNATDGGFQVDMEIPSRS